MNYMIRNRMEDANIQRYPTIYLSAISVIVGGIFGAMGIKGIIFVILIILILLSLMPSNIQRVYHLLEIRGLVMILVSFLTMALYAFSVLCFGVDFENWLKQAGLQRIPFEKQIIKVKSWIARILMFMNFALILAILVRVCMVLFFGFEIFYYSEDLKVWAPKK
jgi:lysylphosphatidylglycerol synthetase-like protein (DUF2156 family)